jgi:hypothetical protein
MTSNCNLINTNKQVGNESEDSGKGESADEKSGDTKEDDKSENVRYRVVFNSLDQDTGDYIDKALDAVTKKDPSTTSKTSNRAFTFRKFMRGQNTRGEEIFKPVRTEVEIEFAPLERLLGKITQKYAGTTKITQMESPYMNLVWSWDEAKKAAIAEVKDETSEEKQAREDLRELMEIISTSSGDEMLDRYFKARDSMKETGAVTFESLWTLFPKGSFIVSRPFFDRTQVFMVQSCKLPDMDAADPILTVIAYSYDWNGFTFNRVPYAFTVDFFPEKKTIFELPFYPLSEHSNLDDGHFKNSKKSRDTIQDLEKRGRKFYEYCIAQKGKQTFRYDGPAFSERGVGIFGQYGSDDDDTQSYSFGANAEEGNWENSTSAVSLYRSPRINIII